jgi:Mitochondrial ribosomal protein (VAR1)
MKKDFKILTEIGNLLYKEKNKPNKFIENDFKKTQEEQEVDSIKIRNDVIYQYLKTFSIFNKRKNGIFIKYNKYISYNFNSKNILLRGVEPQTNKSLKTIASTATVGTDPKININKVNGFNKELNRLKNVSVLTGYNQSANNRLIKYSYKLLFYFFKSMYCLISKPVFLFTPDKVTIQLFYYLNIPKFKVFKWYSILNNKLNIPSSDLNLSNKNNVLSYSNKEMMNKVKLSWRIKKTLFRLNKKRNKVKNILFNLNKFNLFKVFSIKFKLICEILSNKFKKPIELQLIRIHHPFHDSNILVNLLSLNIKNKKFKTNVAIEKLYAKKTIKSLYDYNIDTVNFIPTFLSGIKIRIGGRLMREPIIPRITTKNFERGASSPGKVNFLDTATINKKNKKGSYTIKISSGQNFF